MINQLVTLWPHRYHHRIFILYGAGSAGLALRFLAANDEWYQWYRGQLHSKAIENAQKTRNMKLIVSSA